ncbi:hypothetical protein [Arthrobacter sp. HMWF013]|uniref:hypothetical protein n=1 Tax=Arthrobacter sp. HMWF013 TaxID=2056849 RepID=UPI000D36F1A6|nr:hypothetical protein [Arthrobacter sp. HMWF013]PTT67277.1 hypothetical protein DBR22_09175 [Arthrobacter sp. HMWF013]
MEQDQGNHIRFREVDQDGIPIDQESLAREEGGDPGRPAWASVNPFIVALWLLAALLVIGGVWVSANAASMMGTTSGPPPLAYVLFNFAPWAVLAGLLDALALLFWHALEWQRRKATQPLRTGR